MANAPFSERLLDSGRPAMVAEGVEGWEEGIGPKVPTGITVSLKVTPFSQE